VETSTEPVARPHRARRWLLGLGVLVVLGLGVVGALFALRDRPEAQSVDSVVDRFRASTTVYSATTVPFDRPAVGVYEAVGSGRESLSVPPVSQTDGEVMPITVQDTAAGCWLWRIDYNTAHWHAYEYCPEGDELLLVRQENHQFWDFGVGSVTNVARFDCDPPPPIVVRDPDVGDRFGNRCAGTNSAVPGVAELEGTAVVDGIETLEIGGVEVRAVRQVRDGRFTGAQVGHVDETWWLAADTGLPLKVRRDIRVETDSIIGAVVYEEEGSWQLRSMTPRR